MRHEFEAVISDFSSKGMLSYLPVSLSGVIMEADSLQDDDEYVKFVVPLNNLVQWNGKKIRVTVETIEGE